MARTPALEWLCSMPVELPAHPENARTLLAACLPDGGAVDEAPLASFTFTFVGNTQNVAPLHARIPRVALANASAVQAAIDRSDEEIPIELVPWPGTGAIGRMTPFPPTPTRPTPPRPSPIETIVGTRPRCSSPL